ncbi:hypothetical protein [Parapedobacter indicus]|nr:hypothetical protein [Parapedobacter indicus]
MNELCDDMLEYRDGVINTMNETGVSQDFDFPEMARAAFIRQLDTCHGQFDAKFKSDKIINGE